MHCCKEGRRERNFNLRNSLGCFSWSSVNLSINDHAGVIINPWSYCSSSHENTVKDESYRSFQYKRITVAEEENPSGFASFSQVVQFLHPLIEILVMYSKILFF